MTATTATTIAAAPTASLAILCRALKLPTVARHAEEIARLAERLASRESFRKTAPKT